MGKRFWAALVGVVVAVVTASAQGTPAPAAQPSSNMIVIGCLEGTQQSGFVLKDFRSGTSFRLEAPVESLAWHVGHQLEIHATLQSAGAMPTLKVDRVVYIAMACSPVIGKGD